MEKERPITLHAFITELIAYESHRSGIPEETISLSLKLDGLFIVATPIYFNFPVLLNPSPKENNLPLYIALPPLFVKYTHDSTEVYVFRGVRYLNWTSFYNDLSWAQHVTYRQPYPLKDWLKYRFDCHHHTTGIDENEIYDSFSSFDSSPIISTAPNVPAVIINSRKVQNKLEAFITLPPVKVSFNSLSVEISILPTFAVTYCGKYQPLDHDWLNFATYYYMESKRSYISSSHSSIPFISTVEADEIFNSVVLPMIKSESSELCPYQAPNFRF